MEYRDLTFGVEIEFTGITRNKAAGIIASYFNTTPRYVGGSYYTYEITDGFARTWRICRDSSISTETKTRNQRIVCASEEYSCELITPPLNYPDIEDLQEIVRLLRRGGMFVNSSCGIHIHIGASQFDPKHLRFLCNMVYAKQNLIYSALKVESCRISYCKKIKPEWIKKLNNKKPLSMEKFSELWYGEHDGYRGARYNRSRYCIINLHPLLSGRQPTIEFRCFNSTSHAGVLKSYIQLSILIAAAALNAKSASSKETIPTTGNEKYTFRVWLLKLGMIGDEFKTARLHLLKNLTGNMAWRDRA